MAGLLTIATRVAGVQVQPAAEAWHVPAHTDRPKLAVLPVENLSGVKAPLDEIRRRVVAETSYGGFKGIDEAALETFMRAHRLRYTGGVGSTIARAAREEMGADAVLVTSLETFREGPLPRATLHGRLVSTGENPTILWVDSVGLAGDDAPGLLGLGLITDEHVLLEQAVHTLLKPLLEASREWTSGVAPVAGAKARERHRSARAGDRARRWPPRVSTDVDRATRYAARFRPHTHFRSDVVDFNAPHTIAVIPFLDVSERKHADKILALHFVNELWRHANVTVVEPGAVRERLLTTRSIMAGGPSLAVADLFFHQDFPPVDLVVAGEVFDYQDREEVAKVDFSVQVFEKATRRMVWFSRSYNRGDEDVLFFDLGRQRTAHGLITRMVGSAMERMFR